MSEPVATPVMTPPAAPRPRRRRTILIVLSVVLAMLVVIGGATYAIVRVVRPLALVVPAATPSTVVPTTPSPTPAGFTGALRSLFVPVPASAQPTPLQGAPDGLVSITKAAALWNPTNVQGIVDWLTECGYERGAYAGWTDEAGNFVNVELLQFEAARGSSQWLGGAKNGLSNGSTTGGGYLEGADYGKWVEFTMSSNVKHVSAVFGKGLLGVVVHVYSHDAAKHDLLTSVAEEPPRRPECLW